MPDPEKRELLKRESEALLRNTKSIAIQNIDDEKNGLNFLREIRNRKRKFTDLVEPMRKSAHAAYQTVLDFKKELLNPLEEAESVLSAALGTFRRAEDERAVGERSRIIDQIEEEERGHREREAKALETTGDHAAAAMLRDSPVQLSPEQFEASTALAAGAAGSPGASYREQWACEVVDLRELCKAIGNGIVSPELVKPNMTELNSLARGMKKHLNIPGLQAVMRKVPVTRA
jgi:hypothetical protein